MANDENQSNALQNDATSRGSSARTNGAASGNGAAPESGIELAQRDVRNLIDRVTGFTRPVVSLYATVNPGQSQARSRTLVVRAKNTLRDLEGVSDPIRAQLMDYFESRPPQRRSVVVFANEQNLASLELDLPLSDDGDGDHMDAHVGEPHFVPLLAAVKEYAPHLVLLVDLNHVRAYRVFLGQADELLEATREPTAVEQDEIGGSIDRFPHAVTRTHSPKVRHPHTGGNQQSGPKYVADRGDAARQLADERIERSQAAFYREQTEILQPMIQQQSIDRVIIIGPDRDRHLMLASMPQGVSKHVCALMPGLDGDQPSPRRVLELVQPKISELEAQRDAQLLDSIAERGVRGLNECLEALQEGRLHQLAVPRSLSQTAYLDPQTEYVSAQRKRAELSDEAVEKVELSTLLPELAQRWGANIQFVSGQAEQRVLEEFGGLGGLARW